MRYELGDFRIVKTHIKQYLPDTKISIGCQPGRSEREKNEQSGELETMNVRI